MNNNTIEELSVSLKSTSEEIYRLVLTTLYRESEVKVNRLSQDIGLDIREIIPFIDVLEKRGFIKVNTTENETGNHMVALREMENFIVGLDLGGTKLYGAICDITGNIIYDKVIVHNGKSGEECYDLLVRLIRDFQGFANSKGISISGIGVDVPGRVDLDTGFVHDAPAVKMKNFPLAERLASEFGYLVWVDNDLKQAALGEAWFGLGKNCSNLVVLAIGTGIAASTVVNGEVTRGANARQGELGWMVPGPSFLGRKYHGFGPLETEASGPGILNRAKEIIKKMEAEVDINELTSESVFIAAKQGEEWAKRCIDETLDYLAILIANIMAFYDPDLIILSGGVSRSSEMIIPEIHKRIDGCVLTIPNIKPSGLLYKANVLGALINFTQQCPDYFQGN